MNKKLKQYDMPPLKQKPEYTDLKEHTVYLVLVSWSKENPLHYALLHTGFSIGSYWQIWNNTYDRGEDYNGAYYVEVIKELCKMK